MKVSKKTAAEATHLVRACINDSGREVNNPVPKVVDSGLMNRPPSLQEQIKRLIKTQISMEAEEQGFETWEEANDFEVESDFDKCPESVYELMDDDTMEGEPAPLVEEDSVEEPAGKEAVKDSKSGDKSSSDDKKDLEPEK